MHISEKDESLIFKIFTARFSMMAAGKLNCMDNVKEILESLFYDYLPFKFVCLI